MKYEIYIDAFFLLNFFMDSLLLACLKRILGCTATHLRILFGAAFGAALACVITIVPYVPMWLKLVMGYGMINIGMIRLCFRSMTWEMLLRSAIILYVIAFLFGGILQFAFFHIPYFRKYGMNLVGIFMVGMVGYAFITQIHREILQKSGKKFRSVLLIQGEKRVEVCALLDTGNSLTEPISGKPVSILERCVWEQLQCEESLYSYRVIPYHSIGKKHGLLEGHILDQMQILEEAQKVIINKPVIGISEEEISQGRGGYQMILHPALINNRRESYDFQSGNTGKNSVSANEKGAGIPDTETGRHSLHRWSRRAAAATGGTGGGRGYQRSVNRRSTRGKVDTD